MSLSRLDLDGVGSPIQLAAHIHALEPDLPLDFSVERLCRALDIVDIQLTDTAAFEAALVMDVNKAAGSILLARSSNRRRRRFSLAHELGHFLIPTHLPKEGERFSCSLADLCAADVSKHDRHRRIEAEANRFASHLLMPRAKIRTSRICAQPNLAEIVHLADVFDVSKEAMARSYLDAVRDTLAVVILHRGRIERIYRSDDFPWIEVRRGSAVPENSLAQSFNSASSGISEMEECDPSTWIEDGAARTVDILSEQVLTQSADWAMVLLHAELNGNH